MSSDITRSRRPAIWAGIECTINRVGDQYFDQLEYSGHYNRPGDIDRLAALGIESLRYPILWERHQPSAQSIIDWTFAESALARMSAQHITPIAGLVHHGSGPQWVSFFDGSFEQGLAHYALQVAKKFPEITYYTPINEPLTTARFCGLYGHWYPHGRSDEAFARVLMAECRATVMAMHAIRTINPEAKLVQTDDLGKIYSSPPLQYQADFENERRWLAFDLISGKVKPGHPMWTYLLWAGIDEGELYYLLEHAVIPHIIGLNYYLTSERYIDDSLEHYPAHTHGSNGIHQYADVEAVRVEMAETETGAAHLIREAWNRYKQPLAITEVHLHCSREQQARWLQHIWHIATDLKAHEGIDLRAVTAWAALGSYGWNRLLTAPRGDYEPGVFDVRGTEPRPTALAQVIADIAAEKNPAHPAFRGRGWWETPGRIHYKRTNREPEEHETKISTKPVLILGANGTLGKAFGRICKERGLHYLVWGRLELDLTASVDEMTEKLRGSDAWAVVNASGYVRVDDAESEEERCLAVNTVGAINLAKACQEAGIRLLTFSSDLVFDGNKGGPYIETDKPAPLNVYGRSKALAEEGILRYCPDALVIRTSSFFSPWDEYNFVSIALRELAAGNGFSAADDVYISPTFVPDLVHQSLDLLIDGASGIWHLTNEGCVSWATLAGMAARMAGYDEKRVTGVSQKDLGQKAARPVNSALSSVHGGLMPSIEQALSRCISSMAAHALPAVKVVQNA